MNERSSSVRVCAYFSHSFRTWMRISVPMYVYMCASHFRSPPEIYLLSITFLLTWLYSCFMIDGEYMHALSLLALLLLLLRLPLSLYVCDACVSE